MEPLAYKKNEMALAAAVSGETSAAFPGPDRLGSIALFCLDTGLILVAPIFSGFAGFYAKG